MHTAAAVLLLALMGANGVAVAQAPPAAAGSRPAPTPFYDYRTEAPGNAHRITAADLPAPYATRSAGNSPHLVPRPAGAMPVAPAGFVVTLFAQGLDEPRVLRVAPNGDIFVAESSAGRIRVVRGQGDKAGPAPATTFAQDLDQPYGIAFYPPRPAVGLHRRIKPHRALCLSSRRPARDRAGPAHRCAVRRRRPLDARPALLARRRDAVCRRRIGLECR
jgi:glucose/arabinose dehydrogenase